ncbi:MAG: TetR/AcrR family transcriptional regulator [Endozoicomonas sp.]|uniref:TetR/AcrR family transcriptional regulator n=1 Tax=Endozoicomonas sp. TaxID=1892382 RepID=UPI003D9B25F9
MTQGKKHNRADYINAALTVIAREGAEKLSMRKVASQLNVSAMAIYKHFSNKDELISASLDTFIAKSSVYPQNEDINWQDWLRHTADRMFTALHGEISWLPVFGSIKRGPLAQEVLTHFVKKLTASGFSEQQACDGYFAIIHTVIGAASIQSSLGRYANDEDNERESSHRHQFTNSIEFVILALEQNRTELIQPLN